MEAIEFKGVNLRIAEKQKQYQTIPVRVTVNINNSGFNENIMCFKLDQDEMEQVKEIGEIWLKVYTLPESDFPPLGMNILKPVINIGQN